MLKVAFQRPHSPYDPPSDNLEFIKDRAGDFLENVPSAMYAITPDAWDSPFSSSFSPGLCNMSVDDTYCGTPEDILVHWPHPPLYYPPPLHLVAHFLYEKRAHSLRSTPPNIPGR